MAYIRPLPLAILTAITTSTCSSDRTLTWAAPRAAMERIRDRA